MPQKFDLTLPFEKIETALRSVPRLADLTAIFSQRDGSRLLFVYHDTAPEFVAGDHVEVISLSELQDKNLSDFDGPFAGFSFLDLLRDDLLTKGTQYFPLERFFIEQGQRETLVETLHRLSLFLVTHSSELCRRRSVDFSRRVQAQVILMALPHHLQRRDCQNLIAVIPSHDLNDFVVNGNALFIFNQEGNPHDLEGLKQLHIHTQRSWVVALEEVSLLNEGIRSEDDRFLDLRVVLRSLGMGECARLTCRQLAIDFFRAGKPSLQVPAWALMSEYWLAGEDVDDLTAFCPHRDFLHFAETGDAARVYRVAVEHKAAGSVPPGPQMGLEQWLQHGSPTPYDLWCFSLLKPVESQAFFLEDRHGEFGCILSKAGQIRKLARTLWLTSYDLTVRRAWFADVCRYSPRYEDLIRLAQRACLIYSLADPWEWLRWEKDLKGNYRDLLRMLQESAAGSSNPLRNYYQTLALWFVGWDTEVTTERLQAFLSGLQEFLRVQRISPVSDASAFGEVARRFVMIAERLQDPLGVEVDAAQADTGWIEPLKHQNIHATLKQAVCLSVDIAPVTPLFLRAWITLLNTVQHHQALRSQERDVDRLILQLQKLSGKLRQEQNLLFAPPHEYAILDFAYQQEVLHLERHLQELESAAKLVVNLKNPWLDLHQEVDLTLEITNIGQVEAEGLEIRVTSPRGYQTLALQSIFEIPLLPPGGSRTVSYRIRPERQDADLCLEYTFRDRRGQEHNNSWTTHLHVRNLDEAPYSLKINRYQFGRPIQTPSDFYGRRSELQNILSHLRGGGQQNLLLRGPRRIGKTSMLYILQHVLSHPDTRRLFDIPSSWDTELNRLHPVFLSLHEFASRGGEEYIVQFFYTLLDRVMRTLRIPSDEVNAVLAAFGNRQVQVGPVNAALEQTGMILNEHLGSQMVILLDEYDEVYWSRSGELDRCLREFVSAEQHLTWIISSTLALFEAVKSVSSPWFNIFAILELRRLSDQAAIDLVQKPSQGDGVVWRSDAVLDLLQETGHHPAFTQLFCGRVIETLNLTKTNYVVRETIASIARQIVEEQETAHSHFEFYWSDTPGLGQLILLILDEQGIPLTRDELREKVLAYLEQEFGQRPHQKIRDDFGEVSEWWDRQFRKSIDWTDKITDAISPDAQRRFFFSVPLFRRWLHTRAQNENLWKVARDQIRKEMEAYELAES